MAAYTALHVVISLVGIVAGFVVAGGFLTGRRLPGWTATFLAATLGTTLTGFGFPIQGFTPGLAFGIVTLLVLPLAMFALYAKHLASPWRPVYLVGTLFAQYLNVVVLIVQSFQKLPVLQAWAPVGTEPVILVAQLANLVLFLALGWFALRRFHPAMLRLAV